jgi:hypothetical protein
MILTDVASPILRKQSLPHKSMKRGKRPIANARDKPVLDRIEMNVIDVSLEIARVADGMFPEATLP